MPMSREDHESLLNELIVPDLEHSRRTEILTALRNDHGTTHAEFTELTQTREKLQKDNQDLIISNSKLFRQIGLTDTGKQEEVQKNKAETITIEDFEK